MFSPGEIAQLEKKYSKYLFKKIFKLILLFLLFFAVILSGSYYFFIYAKSNKKIHKNIDKNIPKSKLKKIEIKKNTSSINTTIEKVVKIEDNISKNSPVVIRDINATNKEVIVRKIDNSHTIENKLFFHIKPSGDLSLENTPRKTLSLNIISEYKEKNIRKNIRKPNKKVNKNDTIEEEKISKPKIKIEMQDIDSVRYLKTKYEKTHNIIFALMLCEEFYSQKDYAASLKWSIIANDIDNQSERSWIWFAKSKFRLGKKDDAIRALKAFLRTSSSNAAELLLKSIQNGSLDD